MAARPVFTGGDDFGVDGSILGEDLSVLSGNESVFGEDDPLLGGDELVFDAGEAGLVAGMVLAWTLAAAAADLGGDCAATFDVTAADLTGAADLGGDFCAAGASGLDGEWDGGLGGGWSGIFGTTWAELDTDDWTADLAVTAGVSAALVTRSASVSSVAPPVLWSSEPSSCSGISRVGGAPAAVGSRRRTVWKPHSEPMLPSAVLVEALDRRRTVREQGEPGKEAAPADGSAADAAVV